VGIALHPWPFVSDIAIFVLKRDVKLQLTNWHELLFGFCLACWIVRLCIPTSVLRHIIISKKYFACIVLQLSRCCFSHQRFYTVVGAPPLSSSTPLRRSSPRLATSADGNNETSTKPSHRSRRSLRRTSADGSVVQADSNRNLTSVTGSKIDQAEHHCQLRNGIIKRSQKIHCVNDITEKSGVPVVLSSRQSAKSDDRLIDSAELAAKQPTRRRRKRGWPKGVPKKKQVG